VLAKVNPSVHQVGQGVTRDGLQTFLFQLSDMHRVIPNIEEDMEFQRELSNKQFLRIFSLGSDVFYLCFHL
jgi:hypothetical protein